MVVGFAVLLVFQLVGEVISFSIGRHVPGPVIGMALFVCLAVLIARRKPFQPIYQQASTMADGLLANLGMLFVPAGVGVMQQLDLIEARGLALAAVIVVSTMVTLAVTVWTFLIVKKWLGSREQPA